MTEMDEQENMELEYKATNVFLQQSECVSNKALLQPECQINRTFVQSDCKKNSQLESETPCETNGSLQQPEYESKETFLQQNYKTNSFLQPECETNKEFKEIECEPTSFPQAPCETNGSFLQPECETNDSLQQPECENNDSLQPECETNGEFQQVECKPHSFPQTPFETNETFLQPQCETNEGFQQPESENNDSLQPETECETNETLLQPQCETNQFPQLECENNDSLQPGCETNEEFQQLECEPNSFPQTPCETNEHSESEMNESFQQPESENNDSLQPECEDMNEAYLQPECDHVMPYDEYGFACVDARHDTIERQHDYPKSSLSESQQHALSKFLDQISGNIDNKCLGKLQSHIRRGIPHHLRGKFWKAVLGTNKLQASSKFNYMLNVQLLRQQMVDLNISEYCSSKLGSDCLDNENMEFYDKSHVPVTVIRQISVDVDRTFPLHRRFRGSGMEGVEGRASLFRVLAVYARYNPAVGYCQGMSYIVGMLLMNLEEVDAFWVMVVLFEKAKYLSGYFNSSMGRIQRHAEVFKCLLKQRKPLLYQHLENVGVHPLMFITPWFMCLYTSLPCWDTVLSIWDHLIMEGVTVIFRVGLALLDTVEERIMSTADMSLILPSLLHVPVKYARSDNLLPILWETSVHRWEIDSMQAIVDEEIEKVKQGRKRALMADETDQKSKRAKTNGTEGSLFKRIVNMFTPASQRQQGSSPSNKSQVSTKKRKERNRRYPGHVVTRRQAHLKDDVASTERRLSSVSISPPPDEKRMNDGTVHPLEAATKDKKLKVAHGARYKGSDIGINNNGVDSKASHSKSKDVTSSPKSTRRGSQGFQFANGVRRSPRISSSDYRSRLGKKSLESWQNPFNTPSSRKLISSSAKVQHAFKMFHTPTPLRKNQGRRLQPSPFFSSPEIEMSTMRAPNSKDNE